MAEYTNLIDDEIAVLCGSDDDDAWSELMRRYLPVIEAYAAKYAVSSPEEYENLLSDGVFYGLCNAVRRFDPGRSSFSTFARKCIDNAMLNTLRRSSAGRRIPAGMTVPIDDEFDIQSSDDLKLRIEIREQLEQIKEQTERILTTKEKQAFLLHLQGYSYNEIAEKLDTTRKAAETASARAAAKLRASLI